MSEPIQGCRELNETQKGFGELVIASGDAAVCFDAAEEVFHLPTVTVVAAMEADRVPTTALGWDTGTGTLAVQPRAEGIRVETSIGDQTVSASCLQDGDSCEEIVTLAAIQAHGEGATLAIDYCGEFCVESTFGSAHRLGRLSTSRIGAMLRELDVRAVEVSPGADGFAAELREDVGEQALAAPHSEPAVDRLPLAETLGQVSPRTAGAKHEKHAAQNHAIILPRSPAPSSGTFCSSPVARAIRSIFLAAPSATRESSVDLYRTWPASDCGLPDLFHQFLNTP